MNGRLKFILIAAFLIGLLALIELFYPKPVSWGISLSSEDTAPFGVSVLKASLPDIFNEKEISMSRESFYLMADSIRNDPNYLVICEVFLQGEEDFESMMNKVSEGAHLLLSAYQFSGFIQDSLGFSVKDGIIEDLYPDGLIPEDDSTFLEMVYPDLEEKFVYRRMDAPYSFEMDEPDNWEILTMNEEGKPVSIAKRFGDGKIILNSTPLVFSNYYLLYANSSKPASALLSQLPESPLHWTEFYSRGRGEIQTPLRFVLSTLPLRWTYYLTIFTVLAFVFFEAKRKQKAIRIIQPPRNESLDFIKTVGNLYFESSDHKNIADKKIQYLFEYIRAHFNIHTIEFDNPEFYDQLANKSGKPLLNIEGLFTLIGILQKKEKVHENELRILNDKIEAFLKQ
jgi:hypothetical protein